MVIHTMTCIGDIGGCHHGFKDPGTEEASRFETALRGQIQLGQFPECYCTPVLSHYEFPRIFNGNWVIMSEVDEGKVLALSDICVLIPSGAFE